MFVCVVVITWYYNERTLVLRTLHYVRAVFEIPVTGHILCYSGPSSLT